MHPAIQVAEGEGAHRVGYVLLHRGLVLSVLRGILIRNGGLRLIRFPLRNGGIPLRGGVSRLRGLVFLRLSGGAVRGGHVPIRRQGGGAQQGQGQGRRQQQGQNSLLHTVTSICCRAPAAHPERIISTRSRKLSRC